MSSLKDLLLRKGPKPRAGQLPELSPWTLFTSLAVNGGALQFTESRVIGLRGNDEYECHEIEVSRGSFQVECRVARFGADARIAGLRAFPEGLDPTRLTRGEEIKELPVDMGGIAVVDIATVHPSMTADEEAHEEWMEEVLYGDHDLVSLPVWEPTGTTVPLVESGFGDGSYPLYPLDYDGRTVGLEVEFILSDTEYPF